jgi:hypothetical protein
MIALPGAVQLPILFTPVLCTFAPGMAVMKSQKSSIGYAKVITVSTTLV